MKKIPEVPKEIKSGKLNSTERYEAWLSMLRKYEKENKVTVCAGREELSDFLGEYGTSEVFVVDYRVCIAGRETNYGVHFYFEAFDKACATLVGYDTKGVDEVLINIKDTPLSRWEIYSVDKNKISLTSTWKYTYDLFVECVEYFGKLT